MIKNRDKKILTAFGNHLRKIRESKKMSQETLSIKAGLSENIIGMIERGEVNPTYTTLVQLAKGLGVPKKELMESE